MCATTLRLLFLLGTWAALAALPACGGDDSSETDTHADTGADADAGADADGDGDADADGDADTDSDADADSDAVCIAAVSGKIAFGDGRPFVGTFGLCPGTICQSVTTDASGSFSKAIATGSKCRRISFTMTNPLRFELDYDNPAVADDEYAAYSYSLVPTQEMVSDKGASDYVLDAGTLVLYRLDGQTFAYTAKAGASILADGLAFELKPGALIVQKPAQEEIVEQAQIRVFKTPLEEWKPPFDTVGLDLLYFIDPYWTSLAGDGVSLSFDLPASWTESDKGTLYLLGEQRSSPIGGMVKPIYRSNSAVCGAFDGPATCTNQGELADAVAAGFIADCCSAEVRDGKIVTPPIPRLGWVGIKKN